MNPITSTTLIKPARSTPTHSTRPTALQAQLVPPTALEVPIGTAHDAVVELPMPSREHQPLRARHVVGAIVLVAIALLITGVFVGLPLAVAAHSVFHSVSVNLIIAAALILEAFAVVVFLIVRSRGRSSALRSR